LSLMFLLHVSTCTRSPWGNYIQRHSSVANPGKGVNVWG